MAANTTASPEAAPSVASDTARQLASLASRTGRPSARARSRSRGRPFNHTELAGRGHAVASQLAPIIGEGEGLDLGAAQVDANAQVLPPEAYVGP